MPGELFITMAKEGSTIGGLMDSLGTAVSVALQYGVPIEGLVNKFTHQRFEPAGMTANRDIPIAKSLVDYIFRWMGMEFIPGYREANAPKRGRPAEAVSPAGDESEGSGRRQRISDGPDGQVRGAGSQSVKEDSELWELSEGRSGQGASASGGRATIPSSAPGGGVAEGGGLAIESHRHVQEQLVVRHGASVRTVVREQDVHTLTQAGTAGLNAAMKNNQEDAPACDACGTITVRSGTCYKCLNCGASMGCS
jgi:ribonucleoside-diphosphate reductase alpha chain